MIEFKNTLVAQPGESAKQLKLTDFVKLEHNVFWLKHKLR